MSNEVIAAIHDRRSIRSYTTDAVSDEQLKILEQAAVDSPSANNRQPYKFVFVRNKALLDDFRADFREGYYAVNPAAKEKEPNYDVTRGATCVCFIFADNANRWAPVDSGIAVENLALAAHAIGLGSVILGMPLALFESEIGAKWNEKLGCPENMSFCVAIGIGVPAGTKPAHQNREGLIAEI